jgi:uncharacterized protein YjbI with pentapeptide repeats
MVRTHILDYCRQQIRCLVQIVMTIVIVGAGLVWGNAAAIADDYTKDVLIRVDMSGKDLRDSQFNHTNLRESNLSNTNLHAVNLFAANLEFVNLSGADLSFATLESARITDANLSNANLEGAYTSNAKFDRSNIEGADFTDVDMRDDVRKDLCKVASGVNSKTGRTTRETLFCDY